jgi:hypothetical protein
MWQTDVTYPDTQPDVIDWVGYGSFGYDDGLGGCNLVDGGAGFSQLFLCPDPNTVRVTLALDWIEGDNGIDPYGCGVQPDSRVQPAVVPAGSVKVSSTSNNPSQVDPRSVMSSVVPPSSLTSISP